MVRVATTAYLQATLADLSKAYVLYTQTDLSWNGIQQNPAVLWHLYVLVDPLFSAIFFALCIAAVCWLVSVLTRNYSQVDRIWSIMPWVYTWHFALHRYFYVRLLGVTDKPYLLMFDPRLVCMALLATLWGSRLTYNFHRKGGYSWGSEDYRWPALRAMMPGWCFQILNVFFIAFFQNILLLLLAAPAYIVWRSRGAAPFHNILDSLAIVSFLFFLVVETLTDSQQWNYQVDKYMKRRAGQRLTGEYAYGFIRSGLFRYSRHPNFWAEMSLWWSMYLFSIAATGVVFNWSMIGPGLLTLLFQGSTLFTEHLSEQKYPQYTEYKKVTSRFLPMASGKMKLVAQNAHGEKNSDRSKENGTKKKAV